jgi:hypothetical protein
MQILDSPQTCLSNFQSELLLGRPRVFSFYLIKFGFTFWLVLFCIVKGNLFILFFVLTNALASPTIIGEKTIEVLNMILKVSLASWSQCSKRGYALTFFTPSIDHQLSLYIMIPPSMTHLCCSSKST